MHDFRKYLVGKFNPTENFMSNQTFIIYRTLTANIRKRRQGKVTINIPIFRDDKTPSPFVESLPKSEEIEHPLADHIYMDCMCYGMGCCCLQVRFSRPRSEREVF